MNDFRDLIPDDPAVPTTAYGKIAVPPADIADLLTVVIPNFEPTLQWGPCRWQARDAVSLPAKGDSCLVIWDDNREPWVVAWWPF